MATCIELPRLAAVLDELLILIKETADYHQDPNLKAIFAEAQSSLLSIRRRVHATLDRYAIAVVGLTNVGKSTLLNALLGCDLAPRRNGPCTAVPIEFAYGDSLRLTVQYHRALRRPSWPCDDVEDVHRRLSQLADDSSAEASQSIRRITVEVPHPLFATGLIIADTPGFGAAQLNDADGSHEESLKQYLLKDVSQVFWVVLAEQGIGRSEKTFHDEFVAEVCDDVIVTGCEDWDSTDRQRFRRRFEVCFGACMPRFHFVSGLAGLKARRADDAEALEVAGITLLDRRIRELADADGRATAVGQSLLELADDLNFWMHECLGNGDRSHWWRPDSWSRWRGNLSDNAFKNQLSKRLEAVQ